MPKNVDIWNPEVHPEAIAFALKILRKGKRAAPDRFPKIVEGDEESLETIKEWARTLGSLRSIPDEVWPEAVQEWVLNGDRSRMCAPGDLMIAAKSVLKRWDVTPGRREQLRVARERRRLEIDRQISDGSFGELRGFPARAIEPPRGMPERFRGQWRDILANVPRS